MAGITTKKDVSDKPAKNAVTQPTDPEFKAQDIERKMKLYGVVSALRSGRYPNNAQIDKAMTYATTNSPIDESKLSGEGKKLVDDVRVIIDTARKVVMEKNKDEILQEFLFNTREIDYAKHKDNLKDVPVAPEEAQTKRDAQQASEHLRTLFKLVTTNSEFRKLLKDASLLGQDILADSFSKAADAARPNESALANVDEPAPSNTWEGANGEVRGADERAPDPAELPKLKKGKEQAKIEKENAKKASKDAKEAARSEADSSATGASEKQKQSIKERTLGRIPEDRKQQMREHGDKGKEYLKEKFPEERRQRYIYRLKKVVVEQQRHRDYQDAVEFFLRVAETYGGHAKSVSGQGGEKGLQVRSDPSFQTSEKQLRTLLERFANNTSMDPIIEAVNLIYEDAQKDDELRAWFKELDSYVRRVLQEPGYVMREECDRDGRRMWSDGRKFWDDKYKTHREMLFDRLGAFFQAYAQDPLNVALGDSIKKLTQDLLLDSEGNLQYKPHLWQDIRGVILPQLFEHIGYVPIPRIEYTDAQIDLVIENLTLEGQNLLPNVLETETRNYFKFSPYSTIQDASKHSVWVTFAQVHADLRDVAFFIRKKSGFPRLQDSGLADVAVMGSGISGKVHIESSDKPGQAFKILEVRVKVDKIKFSIREAKHSTLYAMAKPLATGLIKKQIQKAIADAIRSGLVQLDAQLVDLKERMREAGGDEEGATSKMDVLRQTFSRKSDEVKSDAATAKSEKRQSQFKLVGKRDSKIIDWASKDSIVEKQAAKFEHAQGGEGDRWQSPTFDIVSA